MGFTYDKFDIIDVAKKCGIEFYHGNTGGVEYKANCPFCGDRKYHLGLNRERECFHCFKCGAKGNSITLFARINEVSNSTAYVLLKNKDVLYKPKNISHIENTDIPIRSLEERHNVYYDFLSMLHLDRIHRENLINRGLPFDSIHQFMYRSIPTDTVFRREILETLASKHNLIGIPGFYIDSKGDVQMYYKKCGGMFIPVCNKDGYIQGLQMRLDVPSDSDEKKYRWFSSRHFSSGTGAKPWIHIVGDTSAKEACLVEGAMKADITSVLSNGNLFIAIPGVNAIKYLPEVLKSLNVEKVYEALDMDKFTNPYVKKAMIVLKNTLTNMNVAHKSCLWNPMYKGLDDYFYAKTKLMQPQLAVA